MRAELPKTYQGLPVVDTAVMRLLDRAATEKFKIPELELMENAGRAVAVRTLEFLQGPLAKAPDAARVLVCCGRGANGGDGLVAARHLKEAGAAVRVFICPARKDGVYPAVVAANLERLKALGVAAERVEDVEALAAALNEADLVLDSLLGTGASGKPLGTVRAVIQAMNKAKKPVLSVDIPSGIHPDTGYHSGVYVTAVITLALGFPKKGLVTPHAKKFVGGLEVLDIGYPAELVQEVAVAQEKA
ncbi:MAG: NAD(P)H-hydrate epimerase [Elusimicrobia bacterium]|nr:NAD(P)H-hydrate epimerase [Elusimicrobiota bacterium]